MCFQYLFQTYSLLLNSTLFNHFSLLQPLISRNYKGDVSMSEIDYFMPLFIQKEEDCDLTPVLSHGKVHFLWIKHSNLYCILSESEQKVMGFCHPAKFMPQTKQASYFVMKSRSVGIEDIWLYLRMAPCFVLGCM